jgi:diguanylate cyclase
MADALTPYRGEDGVRLATETVETLADRCIPTHPANYEVWATHAAGTHPELSREIARRLQAGEPFTDEVNQALFERFFANTRLSVQLIEAGAGAARELDAVSTRLQSAGFEAEVCATTFEAAAVRCESELSQEDFVALARATGAHARLFAQHNAEMAAALDASARQVERLQAALEAVKVEALTDSLTGIANRKLFDETLRRRTAEAQADGAALCILVCDIDRFKRFNDQWGHAIGDQIIRFVAEQMRQHARHDWLTARYGGEEFAWIMPRTSLADAEAAARELCASVAAKILRRARRAIRWAA